MLLALPLILDGALMVGPGWVGLSSMVTPKPVILAEDPIARY
jgi:hypothetical protein